jgi:hypothetical protein
MTADVDFLIRLRPLADDRSAEVRLRNVLKRALRSERLDCVSAERIRLSPKPVPHGVYSRLPGAGWKLVKRVGSEQAGHDWILSEREKFASECELTVAPIPGPPDSPLESNRAENTEASNRNGKSRATGAAKSGGK